MLFHLEKNRKKIVSPVHCASGEEMHFSSLIHVHLKTKCVGLFLVMRVYAQSLQKRAGFVATEGVVQSTVLHYDLLDEISIVRTSKNSYTHTYINSTCNLSANEPELDANETEQLVEHLPSRQPLKHPHLCPPLRMLSPASATGKARPVVC